MSDMPKNYNPASYTAQLETMWANLSYTSNPEADSFSMVLPPPNVTGSLHMGHGFQITLMDIMVRFARMQGKNVLWQIGTDHAGIATQMIVERQLAQQGQQRQDLSRDDFIAKVMEWKGESGGNIIRQMRELGVACNWDSECFTMDKDYAKAVTHAFVKLYRDQKIYRGKKLVNWDPMLKTAISDLEVINSEEAGNLWYVRYANQDPSKPDVVVATTRPETMFGDVAVAIHPDDPRTKELVGTKVIIPVCNRAIPIITDHEVDPEFGTGCVKITPAHDFNDNRIGSRHNLENINIFHPNATLNEVAPQPYQGLDRHVARERLVAELEQLQVLVKTEPHTLKIPRGDRSNAIIEPYLTDQWYVDTQEMGAAALAEGESGNLKFTPPGWINTYRSWLTELDDWCISRQLWWGHQIPAWYSDDGEIYVGYDENEIRAHYHLASDLTLTQDPDVLDTWFSSALWPFASMGWPADTPKLAQFFPTSKLVTGFDILFFWVARMVMFGLYFQKELPFSEVIITGLIRDAHGQKMSKSKGNVIDPIDLIRGISADDLVTKRQHGLMQPDMQVQIAQQTAQDYPDGFAASGSDAVRFCFAALATPGRDIKFDYARLQGYRNFTNKLWNATRFILMNIDNKLAGQDLGPAQTSDFDRPIHAWMQERLHVLATEVTQHIDQARFDLLSQCLHEAGWHELCDWYIELVKFELNSEDQALQISCLRAIIANLANYLRLLHPVMPYLTEVLWAELRPFTTTPQPDSISMHTIPEKSEAGANPGLIAELDWLKTVVTQIRTLRTQFSMKPSAMVELILNHGTQTDQDHWEKHGNLIQFMGKISKTNWQRDTDKTPHAQAMLASGLLIAIPVSMDDIENERSRLHKKISQLEQDQGKLQGKLDNASFVANAPAEVVTEQRTKLEKCQKSIQQYQKQLEQLDAQ